MNSITNTNSCFKTYTSGNQLSSPYMKGNDQEQFKTSFMKELSESIGKIKEYLAFKERLEDEERQSTLSKPYMSLDDVRNSIMKRETKVTHFIETLTDNQITLLYLLFQAGSTLHPETGTTYLDICNVLYQYVDGDFNFSHTNNRQFKLYYFHDYLFVRTDARRNVLSTLKCLGTTL